MSAGRSVREIAEEWNARAKAEGRYLDQDPWSIPPAEGSLLDPPTPEGAERTATLRKERLERERAAREKIASLERAQEEATAKVQGIVAPGPLPTSANAPPADAPQR